MTPGNPPDKGGGHVAPPRLCLLSRRQAVTVSDGSLSSSLQLQRWAKGWRVTGRRTPG